MVVTVIVLGRHPTDLCIISLFVEAPGHRVSFLCRELKKLHFCIDTNLSILLLSMLPYLY